jgi:hypothetical protein
MSFIRFLAAYWQERGRLRPKFQRDAPVARMTSIELCERQAKVRHEIDEEVTLERGGDLEILHVHMGVFNPLP